MRAFIVLAALLVGAATANAIRGEWRPEVCQHWRGGALQRQALIMLHLSAGPGAPSEMCDTCRTVVRFMKDAMCDPQLEGTLVRGPGTRVGLLPAPCCQHALSVYFFVAVAGGLGH